MRSAIILLILLLNILVANDSECLNRGALSIDYCDNDYNLLADPPTNAEELVDPQVLIFSYIELEGESNNLYDFSTFTEYLKNCLRREVVFYPLKTSRAGVYAMHNGRAHISGFSTGNTILAVNEAGAIPFATRNYSDTTYDNRLLVIVRRDSHYQKLSDLKNKRIAHTSKYSFTGNLATYSLFPPEGLTPSVDYKILFSGKHEQSIMGVQFGDYDAAAVSSEALNRMILNDDTDLANFKIIYQSPPFNSDSFSYAHNLTPTLKNEIKQCFFNYEFPKDMQEKLHGSQHFIPVNYQKDWAEIIKMTPFSDE